MLLRASVVLTAFERTAVSSLNYFFFAIGIGVFIFGIFCAIQANNFDDAKWQATGQNKMLFLIGCPVGGFCCWPIGLGLSLWFWLGIKPKLEQM